MYVHVHSTVLNIILCYCIVQRITVKIRLIPSMIMDRYNIYTCKSYRYPALAVQSVPLILVEGALDNAE